MIEIFQSVVHDLRIQPSKNFRPRSVSPGEQLSYTPRAPWLDKPASGQTFYFINQLDPAAPAAVFLPVIGSEVTVVQFTVPAGRKCAIQAIANFVASGAWIDGSGDVLWRLEADGLAVQGLSAISAMIGSADNPANLSERPPIFRSNQVIKLICANIAIITAPNTNPIVGLLAGFFFAQSQGEEALFL